LREQANRTKQLRTPLHMNRRNFLIHSTAAAVTASLASNSLLASVTEEESHVAILVIDTDRASIPIDKNIYGQFLEHINHSVEDGLFAEQIRGAGFEGPDFQTYWESISRHGMAKSKLPSSTSRMARRASVSVLMEEMQVSSKAASFSIPAPNTKALFGSREKMPLRS
jgi:hypothetical protein